MAPENLSGAILLHYIGSEMNFHVFRYRLVPFEGSVANFCIIFKH